MLEWTNKSICKALNSKDSFLSRFRSPYKKFRRAKIHIIKFIFPVQASLHPPRPTSFRRLRLSMIIDLVIPKQCRIPIPPPKRLGSNILIWEFNFFVRERAMDSMIVVLAV